MFPGVKIISAFLLCKFAMASTIAATIPTKVKVHVSYLNFFKFQKIGHFFLLYITGRGLHLCLPNEFQCRNGLCIDESFKCNNQDNCGDNSDEDECSNTGPCVFGACSQICNVKKSHNFTCQCAPGFSLGWDKSKTCTAEGTYLRFSSCSRR